MEFTCRDRTGRCIHPCSKWEGRFSTGTVDVYRHFTIRAYFRYVVIRHNLQRHPGGIPKCIRELRLVNKIAFPGKQRCNTAC